MNKHLQPHDRIYLAGHTGLVGSALLRVLRQKGYANVITRSHAELDLREQASVRDFFAWERPDHVLLAAAKVGGIQANNSTPADFILQNLQIQTNVIHAAHETGVKKLLFLGSSCIYPKLAKQPIREDALLSGALEPTNQAYAIAKIAGIEMCASYNRQHHTDFICVMPTNLYGPGDNYNLETSHVLPALLRKSHEAMQNQDAAVVVWGTGTPRREFLFSDDLADACLYLMENCDAAQIGGCVNIGVGEDIAIKDLAVLIARTVGYNGQLVLDATKSDGTPRKLLDVSKLKQLGWQARTPLQEGIRLTYQAYLSEHGR